MIGASSAYLLLRGRRPCARHPRPQAWRPARPSKHRATKKLAEPGGVRAGQHARRLVGWRGPRREFANLRKADVCAQFRKPSRRPLGTVASPAAPLGAGRQVARDSRRVVARGAEAWPGTDPPGAGERQRTRRSDARRAMRLGHCPSAVGTRRCKYDSPHSVPPFCPAFSPASNGVPLPEACLFGLVCGTVRRPLAKSMARRAAASHADGGAVPRRVGTAARRTVCAALAHAGRQTLHCS